MPVRSLLAALHGAQVVLAGPDAHSVALAHALCHLHAQDAVDVREAAAHDAAYRFTAAPVLAPLLLAHTHTNTDTSQTTAATGLGHAALDIQDGASDTDSHSQAAIQVGAPSSSNHPRRQTDRSHGPPPPILPTLTAAQASLLASASAVLLPYSPAHRGSFEALHSLLTLLQSHAQARSIAVGPGPGTGAGGMVAAVLKAPLPVQVISVGIEGQRPEVSDAEAAAWVASASRQCAATGATAAAAATATTAAARDRGMSGLALGFTTLVLCAQRWSESVAHEAALQARRAEAAAAAAAAATAASQGRWWHQLCGSSSSTSTSDGNDSPAAWWTDSPTPEVEETDPPRATEDPAADADVPRLVRLTGSSGNEPGGLPAVASAEVAVASAADMSSDEEALLAAAAATAVAATSHSHQHPLPSPTSVEVEALLAQDSRAAAARLECESAGLDESLPRPLSASLHADSAALISPAACKRKCSAAGSGSVSASSSSASAGASASVSAAHSRHGSCSSTAAIPAAPASDPKASVSMSASQWCLAHGAGCAGLRDHACLVQLRSPSGAFAPLVQWPALEGAPVADASTLPNGAGSAVSSSRASPVALQLLRSRKNSHHKQHQQRSPPSMECCPGLHPPKLLVRAWSDGDSDVLAAILPLSCPDAAAADVVAAATAAAALPTTLFPPVSATPASTTHAPTPAAATTIGNAAAATFQHHPTRSPFARYSDSVSAAAAHASPVPATAAVASAVPAQPSPSWPAAAAQPPAEPYCAAHAPHTCTCRGAIVWLLDFVLSGLAAGSGGAGIGGSVQWHQSSAQSQSQSQRWHASSASHSGDGPGSGGALAAAHQSAACSKPGLLSPRWGFAGWLAAALMLLFCALLYSLLFLRAAGPGSDAEVVASGTYSGATHWPGLVLEAAKSSADVDPLGLEFGLGALDFDAHPLPLNAMAHV